MRFLFRAMLFIIPLALWIYNSELFEFNKIVLLYVFSVLIAGTWLSKIVLTKKLIFKRTALDIPILIFLLSQFVSTLVSIDPRTSWLGYYSRFNGGLISYICFFFVYWAYVSNVNAEENKTNLKWLLGSAILVSIYGILQRLGIDKNVWVQDVQERVFSTLGQPNWLGTWLIGLIPLTYLFVKGKEKNLIVIIITSLLFTTLLFTKSRSAILGFSIGTIIYALGTIFEQKSKVATKQTILLFVPLLLIAIVFGTPWTPSITSLGKKVEQVQQNVPVLESGGTESSEIRKIVWQGAFEVWKHYPIVGTGVETFAYSYYKFRPIAHNMVSEWDFLYNKAHNEYLNLLANTGAFGFLSYMLVVGLSLYLMYKKGDKDKWIFISGYVSVLASNFFGFSVVPVNLLMFLLPAFCISTKNKADIHEIKNIYNLNSQLLLVSIWVISLGLTFFVFKYWYADTLYAMGKSYNDANSFIEGRKYMANAVKLSSSEAIYWSELAQSSAGIASKLHEANEDLSSRETAGYALREIDIAEKLSPRNLNIKRDKYFILLKLLPIDGGLLDEVKNNLVTSLELAPTDAKLYYHLAITYMRAGDDPKAMEILVKTLELKPNYKDARLAYAILLGESGKQSEAVNELKYILTNIDSRDEFVKAELDKYTK